MPTQVYRYQFSPSLDLVEVEATITLALLATESLHGESSVRLDAHHAFDAEKRRLVIDAAGEVGSDFNRLFLGFISREFGDESFQLERVAEIDSRAIASSA